MKSYAGQDGLKIRRNFLNCVKIALLKQKQGIYKKASLDDCLKGTFRIHFIVAKNQFPEDLKSYFCGLKVINN